MPAFLDLPLEILEQILGCLSATLALRVQNCNNVPRLELCGNFRQQSHSMYMCDLLLMLSVSQGCREIALCMIRSNFTVHLLAGLVSHRILQNLPSVITRNVRFLICQSILAEGPFSFEEHINVLFPNLQYVVLRETHTIYIEQSNDLDRIKKGFLERDPTVNCLALNCWRTLQRSNNLGTVSLKFDSRVRIFRMPDLVIGNAYPSIAYVSD